MGKTTRFARSLCCCCNGGAVDDVTEDKPAQYLMELISPRPILVNMNGSFQHADVNSSQYFVDHFRQRQKLH